MVACARATGGGFPEIIQQLPAVHMHPGCIAQRTRRLQAEQLTRISRQVAGRCLEWRKRIWTRVYHPNAQVLMPGCARTAGTYQCVTSASLKPHGRVLFSTRASLDRQQTPAASAPLLPPSGGPFRRHGRCCRCAAPHQYVSELGFICPGQACAAVQAAPSLRIRLASAATHGSEARDANKTRPCSFKQAEVAYWYVPAVSAQLGIKPCAFGR